MSNLPTGWAYESLGALTAETRPICYGVLKPGPFDPSGVPLLRIQDLMGNRIASEGIHYISPKLDEEFRRSRLEGGEVLLSIQGTIGRTALVPSTLSGANISRTLAVIKPDKVLRPEFLYYYFQYLTARNAYITTGTTRASLNISTIREMVVPVPPLSAQERIVEAVEEQFSRLDAGIVGLERARQNLRRIHSAVLEAAVPSGESGTTKVQLGDLVAPGRKLAYGVLVPGDHDPNGIPFVRIGDLSNRQVNIHGLKYIAPDIAARFPRTRLQGGEVLLSLVGTIGRSAVVPPELAGANTARALAVIPLREGVESRYVAIALSRVRVTQELTALSHEVARKTLNLEDVRRYEIPLPTYSEQLEIVKAVETEETWIRSVEEVVARTFRRADRLRSSILHTAFSGRLVPQDESNEPASALLAQIANERVSVDATRLTRDHKPRVSREEATA